MAKKKNKSTLPGGGQKTKGRAKRPLGKRAAAVHKNVAKVLASKKAKNLAGKKANKARRENPGVDDPTYVGFHGRNADELVEVVEDLHQHEFLPGLGKLERFEVITADSKYKVPILFGKDVYLCRNKRPKNGPDKNPQLFIRGGDQSVKNLGEFGVKVVHESNVLGTIYSVDYFTRKDHLRTEDGGTAVYRHKFGGRGSPLPTLVYDARNEKLEISGGGYTIPDEGIDH